MQDFVNGGAFPSFSDESTRSQVRRYQYHPREIFKISRIAMAVEKLPRKKLRRVDESVEY